MDILKLKSESRHSEPAYLPNEEHAGGVFTIEDVRSVIVDGKPATVFNAHRYCPKLELMQVAGSLIALQGEDLQAVAQRELR